MPSEQRQLIKRLNDVLVDYGFELLPNEVGLSSPILIDVLVNLVELLHYRVGEHIPTEQPQDEEVEDITVMVRPYGGKLGPR